MRSRVEPLNGVALLLVGLVLISQVDFVYCSPSPQPTSPGKIIHAQAKKTSGQPIAPTMPSPSLGMGQAGQVWGVPVPSPYMTNSKISNNLGLGQANVQTQGKRVYPPKPPTSPEMAGHRIEGEQIYRASPEMASHRISNSPSSSLAITAEAQPKLVLGSPSPSPDPDCTKAQVQAECQTLGSSPPLSPRDTKSQAKQISRSPIAPATPSVIPSSGLTMRDPPTSPPSPKMPIHQGDSAQSPGQSGPTGWVAQWGCDPAPNGCWWTYSPGPGMASTVYPSGSNRPSPNLVAYGGAAGLSHGNGAFYPGLYYYH